MIIGKQYVKCGLIGKTLAHSFSPAIHKELCDYSYELFELSEDELEGFLKNATSFDVCNVTIPYKKAVMPYLDEISREAQAIGSVNTLIRRKDGSLQGENTDYFGFAYMLKSAGIDVSGKSVLILGTGGASVTAHAVTRDLGASQIRFVSRTGDINYENVYDKAQDSEIVINCTPVGMYPHNGESPIELKKLPRVSAVADMIYNPAKTKLLMDAESLGLIATNGLSMLVAQAVRACELFLDVDIDDSEIERITKKIEQSTKSIVLVGMPGCGKSTVASLLADATGRRLIDTDSMVEAAEGRAIPDIFASFGEAYFRDAEHLAVCEAGKQSGAVIATGGGIVTEERNLAPLRQNSTVVFIHRDVSALSRDGRPLSLSRDLNDIYRERLPMYRHFCDLEVTNDSTPENCAMHILTLLERS